jgi:hypothetical protein
LLIEIVLWMIFFFDDILLFFRCIKTKLVRTKFMIAVGASFETGLVKHSKNYNVCEIYLCHYIDNMVILIILFVVIRELKLLKLSNCK